MISDPMLDVGSRRTMAAVLATVVAAVVMAAGLSLWAPVANAAGQVRNANAPGTVAGEYIVVFKNQGLSSTASSNRADEMAARHGGRVKHRYSHLLDGYAAEMSAAQAANLAGDAQVEYVQQAYRVEALDVQNNPPNWGDDRIDQRETPRDSRYEYPSNAGQGAHVYVVDTGVNLNHNDFKDAAGNPRTGPGRDIVSNDADPSDCHGHGTHVAGTAAGTTYGVAKKATVHAVRVLSCAGSGSSANILAGLEWVRANAVLPAVVNYSIGCSAPCSDPTLDNAVTTLVNGGIMWVQAAGNSNQDSCLFSPQKVPVALTIGNMDINDAKAASSSHGACLDVWAPGTNIISAWYTSNTATNTISGTSMASPHVAGSVALYLGLNPNATSAQVHAAIVNNSTPNTITGVPAETPNRMLYTGFMNAPVAERDRGLAGESDGHGRPRGQPGQQRFRRHCRPTRGRRPVCLRACRSTPRRERSRARRRRPATRR